jgi:glycosyltransferase involved in cell wall biosynthesis
MYYELPLILTSVGSAQEVIDDNDIGILIENCCEDPIQLKGSDWAFYSHLDYPENTPHLVRAMEEIYTHRQVWKEKARKGKTKVLSRFTLDKIIQEYEKEFVAAAFEAKRRKESRLELIAREQRRRLDEQSRRLGERNKRLDEQTRKLDEQTRGLNKQARMLDDQTKRLDEGAKRFDEHTREMRERFSQVGGKIFSLTTEYRQGFNFINHQLNFILVRLSLTERIKGLIFRVTSRFRKKGVEQAQHRVEEKIPPPLDGAEEKPLPHPVKKIREEPYGRDKNGFAIICLPIIDWDFRFQRPQQILSQFAHHGYRVFYVTTTFIEKRTPGFEKKDLEDLIQIKKIKENIYTLSLVSNSSLNLYRDSIEREEDLRFLKWSIDILREKADIENLIVYVNLPFWYPLAESLSKESNTKVVYDCMDYHKGFSTNTLKIDRKSVV